MNVTEGKKCVSWIVFFFCFFYQVYMQCHHCQVKKGTLKCNIRVCGYSELSRH